MHLRFSLPRTLECLAASVIGIAPICVSNSSLIDYDVSCHMVPVVNTVDCCVTAVAAVIDYPPNVVLTIGLRNGLPPTLVLDLELVTLPGPVFAGRLGLGPVVVSR